MSEVERSPFREALDLFLGVAVVLGTLALLGIELDHLKS